MWKWSVCSPQTKSVGETRWSKSSRNRAWERVGLLRLEVWARASVWWCVSVLCRTTLVAEACRTQQVGDAQKNIVAVNEDVPHTMSPPQMLWRSHGNDPTLQRSRHWCPGLRMLMSTSTNVVLWRHWEKSLPCLLYLFHIRVRPVGSTSEADTEFDRMKQVGVKPALKRPPPLTLILKTEATSCRAGNFGRGGTWAA